MQKISDSVAPKIEGATQLIGPRPIFKHHRSYSDNPSSMPPTRPFPAQTKSDSTIMRCKRFGFRRVSPPRVTALPCKPQSEATIPAVGLSLLSPCRYDGESDVLDHNSDGESEILPSQPLSPDGQHMDPAGSKTTPQRMMKKADDHVFDHDSDPLSSSLSELSSPDGQHTVPAENKSSPPWVTANKAYIHVWEMQAAFRAALSTIASNGPLEYVIQVGFNKDLLQHQGVLVEGIYVFLDGDLPALNETVV
jgi:hypothetical protein